MYYVIFVIGEAAPYHSPECVWGGRSPGVECNYFVCCSNTSWDNAFPLDNNFNINKKYSLWNWSFTGLKFLMVVCDIISMYGGQSKVRDIMVELMSLIRVSCHESQLPYANSYSHTRYISPYSLTYWPLGDLNVNVSLNLASVIGIFKSSYDNVLRWMPQDLTDDKSTLIQVMAWCRQAITHYLNHWVLTKISNAILRH